MTIAKVLTSYKEVWGYQRKLKKRIFQSYLKLNWFTPTYLYDLSVNDYCSSSFFGCSLEYRNEKEKASLKLYTNVFGGSLIFLLSA